MRLARGDEALVEHMSDESVRVSFVDDYEAGVEGSVPVRIAALGLGGIAEAAGGLKGGAGQAHEFDTWPQAQAFLERHAQSRVPRGHVEGNASGAAARTLPAPDATWWEPASGARRAPTSGRAPKVAERHRVHPELGGALVGGTAGGAQEETVYMRLDAPASRRGSERPGVARRRARSRPGGRAHERARPPHRS